MYIAIPLPAEKIEKSYVHMHVEKKVKICPSYAPYYALFPPRNNSCAPQKTPLKTITGAVASVKYMSMRLHS